MNDKTYCSKCEKCLTDENGTTVIALSITVDWIHPCNDAEMFKQNIGKYAPAEGTKVAFNFCYECWLDSLFGRG